MYTVRNSTHMPYTSIPNPLFTPYYYTPTLMYPYTGIPLKTLSGDYLSTSVDFKECFERAMKARYIAYYP